jgi:hypothetical protein
MLPLLMQTVSSDFSNINEGKENGLFIKVSVVRFLLSEKTRWSEIPDTRHLQPAIFSIPEESANNPDH